MIKQKHKMADVCIVGAGAAGGVLAKKLAESGLKVVVLEAGPHWDPQNDWTSDELDMDKLGWRQPRTVDGRHPLKMGRNNSGFGVGGGTCHFTGVMLRFHESDFETYTRDGVGVDWPIKYQDLEPYYRQIEKEIAVSGPKYFPWGPYHGPYPYPERNPLSANAQILMQGCERLGIESCVTPLAILSAPFNDRPPCTNRGFCNQGCKPNAKFSTLITYVPQAQAAGAEVLPNCMVTRLEVNSQGRISGVTFVHDGQEYQQSARVVIVSAFVVETPRLLLNSACAQFPDGLANSSGMVGKNLMPHSSHDVYAYFDEEIRLYKGTPVLASTQHFYATELDRGFTRGYTIHAHGVRPVAFAQGIATHYMLWGEPLQDVLRDYNHYGRLTLVGEVLPNPANQVTLDPAVQDEYGLPVARVTFSYGENDLQLIAHGVKKCKEILTAAGGEPRFVLEDTAHLHGTCRMGDDANSSVVNGFCQSHDIPNLFICDASVFATSGGGNPTLTVMAVAARTADYIVEEFGKQTI